MDYFQGVVVEFLRTDRRCFINPEYWIPGDPINPMNKPHWFVDIVAVHMGHKCVYLCEVTYAKKAYQLMKRLESWHSSWDIICSTVIKDSNVPSDWKIKPWIFTPAETQKQIRGQVEKFHPTARMTKLEDVLPWLYKWNAEHPETSLD